MAPARFGGTIEAPSLPPWIFDVMSADNSPSGGVVRVSNSPRAHLFHVDRLAAKVSQSVATTIDSFEPLDIRRFNPIGFEPAATKPQEPLSRWLHVADPTEMLPARASECVMLDVDQDEDPIRCARALVRFAALGTPVRADRVSERLAALLGSELVGEVLATEIEPGGDVDLRAKTSVRTRRAALSSHSARAFWGVALGSRHDALPPISVLLATRRPHHLQSALAMLGRQTYGNMEVLVGLHGGVWEQHEKRGLAAGPFPTRIMEFSDDLPLGGVLDRLARHADGTIVTKWDDDDWYGRHHVTDLALALDYSGATIVGKAAEFVMLERQGTTIRRSPTGAETWSGSIAGGTLMLEKATLMDAGGWPKAPRRVDRLLIRKLVRQGGAAYRTHGFEYVLRRSGTDHTWVVDDDYFTQSAVTMRDGLDLAFAGFDQDETAISS